MFRCVCVAKSRFRSSFEAILYCTDVIKILENSVPPEVDVYTTADRPPPAAAPEETTPDLHEYSLRVRRNKGRAHCSGKI